MATELLEAQYEYNKDSLSSTYFHEMSSVCGSKGSEPVNALSFRNLDQADFRNWIVYDPTSTILAFLAKEEILCSSDVIEFMDSNSELKEKIPIIIKIVRKEFTVEKLTLEIINDSESLEEDRTLFVYILSKETPSKIIEKLENIDRKAFDELHINSLLLNIDVRFI